PPPFPVESRISPSGVGGILLSAIGGGRAPTLRAPPPFPVESRISPSDAGGILLSATGGGRSPTFHAPLSSRREQDFSLRCGRNPALGDRWGGRERVGRAAGRG